MRDITKTCNTREKIEGDLDSVKKHIREIASGRRDNFVVVHNNYISPSIITAIVSRDNPSGELRYYKKLKEILQYVLAQNSMPKDMLPDHAPDYLRELAVKKSK